MYGATLGVFLALPVLVIGTFEVPGGLGIAAFLVLFGLLVAYTAALLHMTERSRLRRVRSRLKVIQRLHEDGLLGTRSSRSDAPGSWT